MNRDVKAVHGDFTALLAVGVLNRTESGGVEFPFEAVKVEFLLRHVITADTVLRLCRFFRLSDGWWLRLQADYDTEVATATLAKTLAKIKPWAEMADDAARAY